MTGMMMMTRRGDDESRRATRPVGFFWFLVFERLNPATRCLLRDEQVVDAMQPQPHSCKV